MSTGRRLHLMHIKGAVNLDSLVIMYRCNSNFMRTFLRGEDTQHKEDIEDNIESISLIILAFFWKFLLSLDMKT